MPWNWELPNWPQFSYDANRLARQEREFLLSVGKAAAFVKTVNKQELDRFIVEILSTEGLQSSKIEGEILDRESLQSSIKQHFGLRAPIKRGADREARMAKVLCDVYDSFDLPLTDEMLCDWHAKLFDHSMEGCGKYRTHPEPMQIVSHRFDVPQLFFEAPPSTRVKGEMSAFVKWFNSTSSSGSILGRAAIAHVYFECVHPFEDGNGRIGRFLVEKVLSQGVGRPILIAVSKVLEKRKKEYYASLEQCNRTLDVQQWVDFFVSAILQAQEEAMSLLDFLIAKSKILTALAGKINPRQEKALLRMFAEGPSGFKGGLSSENYCAITQASKATATRDLADLVQQGALVKTGALRHTRYWLNLGKYF
jgi:Fic family protein